VLVIVGLASIVAVAGVNTPASTPRSR